jgi:hypothetical protein
MSAAASSSADAFLILGHGTEDIAPWVERHVIPKGYTLITVSECGIYTTTDEVCPMTKAFSEETYRSIFMEPVKHKKQIEKIMKGKEIHIYTEGKRYPQLTLQMFLDWPTDDGVKMFKSGVYPFPIDFGAFQIGEGKSYCDKLFKKIGPYKGFSATIPADYDPKVHFEGSKIPTVDEVTDIIKTTKKSGTIKNKLTIPLEDIFKKCGPGIYYYVICRSPKNIKAPSNLREMNVIPERSINKYKPFLNKHWPEHVNEIIPLLEENIKHTSTWVKNELESTVNNYKKLSTLPLIRRLSIAQQESMRPKSIRNFIKENKSKYPKHNTMKKMKYSSNRKYAKSIKHNKHMR